MTRIARYSKKSYAARFKKDVEKALIKYTIDHEVNESDVIQAAVECFLLNPRCEAKQRKL